MKQNWIYLGSYPDAIEVSEALNDGSYGSSISISRWASESKFAVWVNKNSKQNVESWRFIADNAKADQIEELMNEHTLGVNGAQVSLDNMGMWTL